MKISELALLSLSIGLIAIGVLFSKGPQIVASKAKECAYTTLTPTEKDDLVRTVVGETWHPKAALSQPEVGKAAVIWVILNRRSNGLWGPSVTDVVKFNRKGTYAFEPWMSRAKQLNALSRNHRGYREIKGLVDRVQSCQYPDITNGALYFCNKAVVRSRNKAKGTPGRHGWCVNAKGLRIGEHTFFKRG